MAPKKEFSHSTPPSDGPHTPDVSHLHNVDVHHEESDVNSSGIYKFGLWMIVIIIGTGVLMWLMYRFLEERQTAQDPAAPVLKRTAAEILPPEPRLQLAPGHEVHPLVEMAEMRKQEDVILTTYGWVDKSTGAVRIPIKDAKVLLLQKGLPVDAAQGTTDSTGLATSTSGSSGSDELNYRRAAPSQASSGRVNEWRDK